MVRFLMAVALAGALLIPHAADAETKRARKSVTENTDVLGVPCDPLNLKIGCRPLGGNTPAGLSGIANPLAKPLQDLATFISGDAQGASALAVAIPELQDLNGKACWDAMQLATKVFDAHPVPATLKLMTDHEALRLLIMATNKLCVNTACTVVFADAANIAQTASPIPVPIPSLQSLCSKVAELAPTIQGLSPPIVEAPSTK
jgi:hypothetical protein